MESPLPSWILTFEIGNLNCALSLAEIGELLPMVQLSPVPMMPAFVEGILNLGGSEVPVLRLDKLLNLAEQPIDIDSILIVLRSEDQPFAIVVNNVDDAKPVNDKVQVIAFDDERSFQRCFTADLKFEEETYHLLSAENLLLAEERKRLTEFQKIESDRNESLKEVALAS